MTVGSNSQPFYLINENPASSASTLFLRTPGRATEYHTAKEEYCSSIYFATTTPSSPYMRLPRALPSQDGLHDCPPELSSPLMFSTSSAFSSPYFVAMTLERSDSGTSTSSEANRNGDSRRDMADHLGDWYYGRRGKCNKARRSMCYGLICSRAE